MIAEQHVL